MPLFELSRMDSPPKLTGETLIVHHIPLVHCQVPDRQCCGGASGGSGSTRPNPFCPPELGITQPDQDLGQADSLLYNSLHSAPGGSVRSTDSTKNRGRDGRGPGPPKRHNPFLLQESVAEPGLGDLYDDSICDSATQQSFHLHGAGQPTFHLSSFQLPPPGPRVGRPWGATCSRAGVVEGQEQEPAPTLDTQPCSTSHSCRPELEAETMELDECGGPGGSGSGGGASDTSGFSFDQEWKLSSDESPRNPGCSGSGAQHCRCSSTSSQSEAADQSMGYVSDSSYNSSDGVLVTFSTLYNKMHSNSHANLNSAPQSCSNSSFCSHSDPGAFYLDLQTSPAESKMSCESHHPDSGGREGGFGCPHASSPELDANCNSYQPHCEPCPAVADLTACFQSQARLVVATQNYYKLVTCDLSSQSSPSPAGSSITSCSEEHTKISPAPGPGPSQPSEYYLFQKPEVQPEEQEVVVSSVEVAAPVGPTVIEGQVYTNTSPPNLSTGGRQRSRSYDRSLERSPSVRLGSLERMLSCPVRLSEGPAALAGPSSPPRRVTSFAELAKGRKKAAGSGSPPLRVSTGDSSQEFSPIQEARRDRVGPLDEGTRCSHSLPPMPLGPGTDLLGSEPWSTQVCQGPQSSEMPPAGLRAAGQGPLTQLMDPGPALPGSPANSHAQRDARARADANHLSPQALKWREYRRKNPLGPPGLSGSLDRRPQEARLARRNPIFEFPGSLSAAGHLNCRLTGQVVKPLPLTCPDFQDPFSLTEKPPAEFCLSPDGNSEAISIDLLQKKGLVKAVNTAVDLIVAHFGTSRDPGVKAKLGNSSVSPNVAHLVLKYLCPAVRAVLEDGLKAFVLDVIIGQRKNMPWSVVEASTKLGPSTKVLHGLYNKVSQFPELTSHTMRFNAFILGLLNVRSLEFWFNHLYNHEEVLRAHYQPWGLLRAARPACPGLADELLLLLQPLALLPFSLDLLFQHRLRQRGRRQRRHKELLRGAQALLLSARSTLQLARAGPGERAEGVGAAGAEEEQEEDADPAAGGPGRGGPRGGQSGWWYQLMQSSQVYIEGSAEGSRFPRGGGGAGGEKKGTGGGGPPPREGVVEGAEACPATEEATGRDQSWPSWMGSPPDSVLAELRCSREREGPSAFPAENETEALEPSPGGIKWGHLFGSRKAQREARPTNRLPSDWLSLDKSMFQLMAQTVGNRREPEPKESLQEPHSPAPPSKPPCEVKALCHHLATGPGQLSFHKGDTLRVLGPTGGDWLHCSRGPDTGLVPQAYVTLTTALSSATGSSQN
ncbi:AP-4 complex accessory subunit RUSC2 isoform X2 [Manis javanica]|uniref:AP-4 complex accessory subunit RUSC2 isoform X2 n=1 Tax=Manis javanica TaxID=9974 RepID=UPI00187A0660|nr:iporin isoform X2 [Manis javanica]